MAHNDEPHADSQHDAQLDASEIEQSTVSKPLKERLLPQTSIRFFLFLTAMCAAVMVLFRAASDREAFWTKIFALLIVTTTASFVAYVILFLIANLFSASTEPIAAVIDSNLTSDDAAEEVSES